MKNVARTPHRLSYVVLPLCIIALTLLSSPAGVSAALPKTAKLLPPDAAVVVSVENFSRLKTQFEKTNVFQLYKDPSMSAFIDDFKKKWGEKMKQEDSEVAKIVSEAATLPEGKIALALVVNARTIESDNPPVVVVAEWGEKAAQVKDMVNKITTSAVEEKNARRQSEDYRGVSITSITRRSNDALSYCFIDDAMILSADPESLKFVIAQAKGAGSPTLADVDDYNSTLNAVGSDDPGRINLFINIKHIIKTAIDQDKAGKVKQIVSNLGFDNVTSLGFSIGVGGGPGGTSEGKALIKIDGAKKGICKLLEVESGPVAVPRFVPESASAVSLVNLNMGKAFDEMVKILTAFSPQMAMMVNMPLSPPGQQGEPPLQLKTGIIDHLGAQILVSQSMNGATAGAGDQGIAQPDTLVALATTNRAALEKTLLLLHSTMMAPGKPDARRELLGHTIYQIDLGGMLPGFGGGPGPGAMMQPRAAAGAPGMPKLAFTVTDTHLIFATEDAVERAIRTLSSGTGGSVASAKWFAQAKSTIPSSVGMAGLQNSEASMEAIWSTLRSMKTPAGGPGMTPGGMGLAGVVSPQMMISQMSGGLLDFSLLPEFNTVRKYFGLSASYGIARQDGFFFEFKNLNPK